MHGATIKIILTSFLKQTELICHQSAWSYELSFIITTFNELRASEAFLRGWWFLSKWRNSWYLMETDRSLHYSKQLVTLAIVWTF